jgi:hypothetical protein
VNGKLRHSNRRRMAKEKERMRWGMSAMYLDAPLAKVHPRRDIQGAPVYKKKHA